MARWKRRADALIAAAIYRDQLMEAGIYPFKRAWRAPPE